MARTPDRPPDNIGEAAQAAWWVLRKVRDRADPTARGLAEVASLLGQPAVTYKARLEGIEAPEAASRLIHEAVGEAPQSEGDRAIAELLMATRSEYRHKNLTARKAAGEDLGASEWTYKQHRASAMVQLSIWLADANERAQRAVDTTAGLPSIEDLGRLEALFQHSWSAFAYLLTLACMKLSGKCDHFLLRESSEATSSDWIAQTLYLRFWEAIAGIFAEDKWWIRTDNDFGTPLPKEGVLDSDSGYAVSQYYVQLSKLLHLSDADRSRLRDVFRSSDGEYGAFETAMLSGRPIMRQIKEVSLLLEGEVGAENLRGLPRPSPKFATGYRPPWPLCEVNTSDFERDTTGYCNAVGSLLVSGVNEYSDTGRTVPSSYASVLDSVLESVFRLASVIADSIVDDDRVNLLAFNNKLLETDFPPTAPVFLCTPYYKGTTTDERPQNTIFSKEHMDRMDFRDRYPHSAGYERIPSATAATEVVFRAALLHSDPPKRRLEVIAKEALDFVNNTQVRT